jgi:hypothetical protein
MKWFSVRNFVALGSVTVLAVGAFADNLASPCRAGERVEVMDTMYFGTATPDRTVTPDEWREFVNKVVTPRFPDGLTSWEASGQWRTATGVIHREPSYVLHVVHEDSPESERAVREVTGWYKTAFQQEAVLRVRATACTSL